MINRKTVSIALVFCSALTLVAQKRDKGGNPVFPADYRDWTFLSSSLGLTYSDRTSEHPLFGNVFVNPEAYRSFRKTGTWPHNTFFVIEARVSANDKASKDGKYQTKVVAYETHVRDGADNGWNFYEFKTDGTFTRKIEKHETCAECHEKNAATDTTFVQFYPTLIDTAKQHNNYREPAE